ncbi:MBL fold metallo-hydrolase [Desulfobacula toluolica]|uniref:Beta-lactamase domain protein n=1 Tax=Desulfobacula toluolica (strain DSM 7467 / Tol2) TaxID=651182 RepID=K0N3D9_DESTT|nr:MBL fold metallo-hydrolase [Desulfobacula toluolica]CCK78634.1 beta-lactamase domain protein [Desulfobacula toluolica Tol2]
MKNNSFSVCPLASGSKGNSLFVSCNNSSILIDAGLSGIEIQRRLTAVDIAPENLTAIIITHEHSDHIKGAGILSRRFDIPVYITKNTYHAAKGIGKIADLCFFECGIPFEIDQIMVSPFSISHDAEDPAGLTMEYNGHKIGIATDLGIATTLVKQHLKDSNILYLESNHDPDMLINGPYPWHLKQRIRGRTGHLSNMDAKQLVSELKTDALKHVILAHLSEENNCPRKAVQEVSKSLNASDIVLHVAGPDKPGKVIQL